MSARYSDFSQGWRGRAVCVAGVAILMLAILLTGCSREDAPVTPSTSTPAAKVCEVLFAYGSEKEKWVDDVTASFNGSNQQVGDGLTIHVTPKAMGSGALIDDVLAGQLQAVIVSPASGAFIKLGNARSRAMTGKNLFTPTENLLLSPVVIAMWNPMADALSSGGRQVGWADILKLAQSKNGWAEFGHPEWGSFKFGHTHPEYSNSGLISLIAECYAGAGKVKDLSRSDLEDPKVTTFLRDVERSVVHYGTSTGFFGRRMFADGPAYLSAAVLYENMVIEASQQSPRVDPPIVAIYPTEDPAGATTLPAWLIATG